MLTPDSSTFASAAAQTVGAVLDELAKRFGATGAHLWQVLVRQVYVTAITDALTAVVLLAMAGVAYKFCMWSWRDYNEKEQNSPYNNEPQFARSVVATVAVCGVIVAAAIVALGSVDSIAQLANPEYGALKMVLDAVKR